VVGGPIEVLNPPAYRSNLDVGALDVGRVNAAPEYGVDPPTAPFDYYQGRVIEMGDRNDGAAAAPRARPQIDVARVVAIEAVSPFLGPLFNPGDWDVFLAACSWQIGEGP
jgi:hypothetical protein